MMSGSSTSDNESETVVAMATILGGGAGQKVVAVLLLPLGESQDLLG